MEEEEQRGPVHMVGSSVNLPDMSAHLKAKVAVSADQQADPRRLAAVYDDMAAKFARHGLTLPAVEAMRQYFANLEGAGEWARVCRVLLTAGCTPEQGRVALPVRKLCWQGRTG